MVEIHPMEFLKKFYGHTIIIYKNDCRIDCLRGWQNDWRMLWQNIYSVNLQIDGRRRGGGGGGWKQTFGFKKRVDEVIWPL